MKLYFTQMTRTFNEISEIRAIFAMVMIVYSSIMMMMMFLILMFQIPMMGALAFLRMPLDMSISMTSMLTGMTRNYSKN